MSFVNLTLNTKTYGATRIDSSGTSYWTERSAGVANGFSVASLSIVDPSASKRGRVGFRIDIPTVATADSACVCTGQVLRDITMTFYADIDGSSSSTEKADALARLVDFVQTAEFAAAFESFTPPSASA